MRTGPRDASGCVRGQETLKIKKKGEQDNVSESKEITVRHKSGKCLGTKPKGRTSQKINNKIEVASQRIRKPSRASLGSPNKGGSSQRD